MVAEVKGDALSFGHFEGLSRLPRITHTDIENERERERKRKRERERERESEREE